jgi:phosphoribosylaminoimidazole-succinocarboxamide synthase
MIQTIVHKPSPLDDKYIQIEYLDQVVLGNAKLKIKDLGKKITELSTYFFEYLTGYQVPTAYVKKDKENVIKFVNYSQFNFVVKILNHADKRIAKIFGVKENSELKLPIYEFRYGSNKENIISESHILSFDLCNAEDIKLILRISSKVNAVLKAFFERRKEVLTELDLSFGKFEEKIHLCGEFSPFVLKVFPFENNPNWIDPNKMKTAAEIKKYTDFLHSIVSPKQ